MSKRNQEELFSLPSDLPVSRPPEPKLKAIRRPIWTENKAKLIERYLYYFVLITRHGTYIDGFAGPSGRAKRLESNTCGFMICVTPSARA